MENETKSVTFVNYAYKFIEMDDEMTKSIENIDNVIIQQKELIAVIEKHPEDAEKFKFFINSLNEQTSNLEAQKKTMKYRQHCIKQLVAACQTNEIAAYAASMLLEGLGLENKEGKPIEQRQDELSEIKK